MFAVLLVLAVPSAGCRRRAYLRAATVSSSGGSAGVTVIEQPQAQPMVQQPQVQAQAQAQAQFELLYLPVDASMVPLHLIQAVVVQTDDGRTFQLTQADVQQAMGARVAVRVPAGVTTGTATVYLVNGQTWSTTFHIAASSSGLVVGGGGAPVSDPRCGWPSGTWQGQITDDPRSTSTVWLEVLGDCRTVRGYVHLESSAGSIDSTIEGTWDVASMTIVARDTQLFNVRPMPGGSFCATDEYRLQLSGDGGMIEGRNNTWSAQCRGSSRVWLRRGG